MLHLKTPDEVLALIQTEFAPLSDRMEPVPLEDAIGRVLAEDIRATEYVPDFNRSTVDGYAVQAKDTFGCSESIPAILPLDREIRMGEGADFILPEGACCAVPTGGAIPQGADCAVMIEYTENYGDGSIGITKAGAPGQNMIFRGDDVHPGKVVLTAGRLLSAQDIGALAAIGCSTVPVARKLTVGIISTGDELVPHQESPGPGQVRDVNSVMLCAMLKAFGLNPVNYGIVLDNAPLLEQTMRQAVSECDAVLISGGSSVGVKDATCRTIESMGTLLLHGIAIKPGKPTIMGNAGGKPLIGLPGHPVAAYFITRLFALPLFGRMLGRTMTQYTISAELTESMGANHGRAQYSCCRLEQSNGRVLANPIRSKSGLITTLAGADGYFCIERDCEGLPKGAIIPVTICAGE